MSAETKEDFLRGLPREARVERWRAVFGLASDELAALRAGVLPPRLSARVRQAGLLYVAMGLGAAITGPLACALLYLLTGELLGLAFLIVVPGGLLLAAFGARHARDRAVAVIEGPVHKRPRGSAPAALVIGADALRVDNVSLPARAYAEAIEGERLRVYVTARARAPLAIEPLALEALAIEPRAIEPRAAEPLREAPASDGA